MMWYANLASRLASLCLMASTFAPRTHATSSDQDAEWADLARRNLEAEKRLTWQQPQAVRKMSEGEKFWPSFWQFDDQASFSNISLATQPFAPHSNRDTAWHDIFRRTLSRRDGTCPTDTNACTSINQPNSCCPSGSTCINVQDTGNGPVGCCAAGQTCGTTIPGCNTSQGYTSCPNSDNKGCCIPGYACSGNICINVGTQTITPTTSTTTTTSTSSPISVLTIISVNTSGFTTTATVTATVTATPSSSTTSATAVAPVRPTSSSTETVIVPASASTSTSLTTITTSTTTAAASVCPTGYYMCSAVYLGGCCQVDRDCNTTSCPSTATTTVINGSPTVVAPVGATSANQCANGWYSCPASLGGNCCPSGFDCAPTNCLASVSGVAPQNKQSPSEGAVLTCVWSFLSCAVLAAVGMLVL